MVRNNSMLATVVVEQLVQQSCITITQPDYRLGCLSRRIDGLLQVRLDWIRCLIIIRGVVYWTCSAPLTSLAPQANEGLLWNNIHTSKTWPALSPRMHWQVLVVFACLLTIATACIPQHNSSATLRLVRWIFYLHTLSPWAQFRLSQVAPTCFGLTLPSSGRVPSAFWEKLNWGAVDRILWMGVLCLVTWCVH
jgi:hypothetical protein